MDDGFFLWRFEGGVWLRCSLCSGIKGIFYTALGFFCFPVDILRFVAVGTSLSRKGGLSTEP
jgi:hypothetical protein